MGTCQQVYQHCTSLFAVFISCREVIFRNQQTERLLFSRQSVLQSGVVTAFGLVRGGAQADMLQLSVGNPLSVNTLAQVGTLSKAAKLSLS